MLKARRHAETTQRARLFTISSAEEHSSSELSFRRHTVVSLHRGDAASACGCTVYLGLSRDGDGVNNILAAVLVTVLAIGFLSFSTTMYAIVQCHTRSYQNTISPFVHYFIYPLFSWIMNGRWIEIGGGTGISCGGAMKRGQYLGRPGYI